MERFNKFLDASYEIAEKVGYKNVDYFHTKFKKYVEMSPAEFRKKNKDTI